MKKLSSTEVELKKIVAYKKKRANKTVALLCKSQNIYSRSFMNVLLAIYEYFVGTYSDYGDIIYDQAFNNKGKIYQELDLESLQKRSWYRKLSLRKKCPYLELFCSAFSRIQSDCGKMQTRVTPNTDTFPAVYVSFLSYIKTNALNIL